MTRALCSDQHRRGASTHSTQMGTLEAPTKDLPGEARMWQTSSRLSSRLSSSPHNSNRHSNRHSNRATSQ